MSDTRKRDLYDARADLRRLLTELAERGFKVTSMRMTQETAKDCRIELNAGGFGEYEGVRIKAGTL